MGGSLQSEYLTFENRIVPTVGVPSVIWTWDGSFKIRTKLWQGFYNDWSTTDGYYAKILSPIGSNLLSSATSTGGV